MFEVDHDHHGQEFTRFFSPGRSSMSAMDDKRAEAFRRHVWAVTMIDDEAPLSEKLSRHSTHTVKEPPIKRPAINKLKRRRRSVPVQTLQEQAQQQAEKLQEKPQEKPKEKPKEKLKEKRQEKPREKSRLKPRLKIIEKRQEARQQKSRNKPQDKPKENSEKEPVPILPEPEKLSPPSYQEYCEKECDTGFQPDLQVKYRERPQVQYKAYCPPYSLEENRAIMKGPTVTIQPVHPSTFGPVAELYSVKDDVEAFLTGSKKNRPPRTSYPTSFSVVHELETPASNPTKVNDSMSMTATHKPRKPSSDSTASIASIYSNSTEAMSLRSRRRTSSWGSKSSVETTESSTGWKPDYLTQQPLPIQTQTQTAPRSTYRQNELFGMMPSEVLSLVLCKLRDLHLESDSLSCATCWMRDVCSVLVTSRKWCKTARVILYEDIQLVGSDSPAHKKKYKLNQGARVMMLRRTLRANPYLASLVRILKVPAPELSGKASSVGDYDDLIATLVMTCPNLESLSGPTTTYDYSFKKIFHALCTRSKLKEMNWVMQVAPQPKQQRIQPSTHQPGMVMPGELTRVQEIAFLDHHVNWEHLETLSINCYPGAALTSESLITNTIKYLPSLMHLHLCNIPRSGFNDDNLLALPALESLTLSHIAGITSNGLSSFATRSTSRCLRKLHLRHTPLTSLAALARILSNLRSLVNFALIQSSSPVMPEEDSFTLWMMPYLASSSLKKLHWDITAHALSMNNAADDILARSIVAGGFPELTTLRVANDPDGLLQDVCYPVERIDLPQDRFRSVELAGDMPSMSPMSTNGPIPPARHGLFKTASNNSIASLRTPQSLTPSIRHPLYTNLHASRLAAQARLEAARSRPRFTVNVIDDDGTAAETYTMAGFLGTFGSRVKYHLLPDANSVDEKGGLPDVRDLENEGGESLIDGREGCLGRWNTRAGVVADRKEKETWYHTERGRWTKPTL